MAAAVLLLNIMAQNNTTNATDDVKPTILHDFLGRGCAPATKFAADASSPSASVSGGGARGGGPVSTTSDLGSERQVGTHFEGVPFFGQKGDFSGSKIRYSGNKRSNSDSVFMAPSRDGIPQLRPDFPETSHLMKMLRNVGAERPRWPHEDESFMGVHQMRPTASSLMVQPATGSKTDANASKWERAIPVNVGPVLQYPPRVGQVVSYGYQAVSNRFKDANVGSSVISQSAADEGSRTGIKGSGILSSVNVMAEPSSSKQKSLNSNTEPGSSAPLQRQGSTSASRQMTIFYGGQAHVFDDVHPNKADVIMALAGSNGGSWSTSFSPNSAVKPSGGEAIPVSGENDTIMAAKTALSSKDNLGRLYSPGNSSHGLGSSDRMLMLSGGQSMKDARGAMQDQKTEEKQ
ncbi:protein TIFY 8-like [Cynara cardunculus var. scolymus]|uniref:Protein TIFY n=1 Tax=Cynara cardunculus var. scolymus TaxID=59895 RepID=A0A103XGH4_CYNCS|nr:protein TIFY 8-like [Cynara cardunculus var. scolymus]KVH90328.1 Tify [Cynara cardunculus var. scolymus]